MPLTDVRSPCIHVSAYQVWRESSYFDFFGHLEAPFLRPVKELERRNSGGGGVNSKEESFGEGSHSWLEEVGFENALEQHRNGVRVRISKMELELLALTLSRHRTTYLYVWKKEIIVSVSMLTYSSGPVPI